MRSDQPLPLNKRIGFNFTLHVKHIGNVAGVVGRVWITLPRNWRSSLRAAETHCPADLQGSEARAAVTALRPLGQLSAGAGGATGTELAVQPVFDHLRLDRLWIAASATRVWHMIMGLLPTFHWQVPRSGSGSPWLATPFAAPTFARFRAGLFPCGSLEHALDALRDLRLMHSHKLASSAARAVRYRSCCSFSRRKTRTSSC
jgi:hypothetical protein